MKKYKNKKIPLIILLLVFVIFMFTYLLLNNFSSTEIDERTRNPVIDKSNNTQDPSSSIPKDDTYVENDKNNNSPINVSITRATRSVVSVYFEKIYDGTCKLTLSQGGEEKVFKEVKILPMTDYSTCEGFNLNNLVNNDLPFTVEVEVNSLNRKGSASQKVL